MATTTANTTTSSSSTLNHDSLYECALFGKLESSGFSRLRERVIAICGEDYFEVKHHEVIMRPLITTPLGPARNEDVTLRCRSPYVTRDAVNREKLWQIFMMGTPEARPGRTITIRPVLYAPLNGNPLKYAYNLGYSLEFETAREGFTYFYKNNILINIYKLYKVGKKYDLTTLYNVDGMDSWVVEVSSIPIKLEEIEQATTDIRAVQNYLQGLVELEYIDHLILQNAIIYRATDV